MKTIALLLCSFSPVLLFPALAVVPAVMDLTLECDPLSTNQQVRAYRFFERLGTNWNFLGSVPTNRFTVTNVNVTVPHTYGVTASNVLGETEMSVPCVSPSDPKPPSNLNIIQTSLVVPVNSIIAASTDLVTWQEKQTFRLMANTNGGGGDRLLVTFKVLPRERVQFWQEWTGPAPPPLPGGAR